MTEDISLREFDSPIGWKVIGARAYLESTQHFPPLLEEPSQNVVFSIVFRREFVFDAFMGATQRSPSTIEQVGHFKHVICLTKLFSHRYKAKFNLGIFLVAINKKILLYN